MLPSNDQIANQSCSFGQQKMATLFGVVEKYTRNRFQLSESVPLRSVVASSPGQGEYAIPDDFYQRAR